MRSAVEEQFRTLTGASDTIISFVDVIDECVNEVDPGKFLLQRFATSSVFKGFREKGGVSIQDYMVKNGVLRNNIIWLKGLEKKQAAKWVNFCKNYNGNTISDGLFVIELHEDVQLPALDAKNTKAVIFKDCVREYDVQQFNSFILDEQDIFDDAWRQYISTLAANLCQTDAEVSELYLRISDFKQEDPLIGIGRIAEHPEFVRRGEDRKGDHVLSRWRANDYASLSHRIWKAQLQTLFPIIELQRVTLINSLYPQIQTCLNEHYISQFGTQITDPLDVELGTLVYLIAKHDEEGYRYLYVPDSDTREQIHFLKECRNLLAHGNCCTHEQVCQLLSMAK